MRCVSCIQQNLFFCINTKCICTLIALTILYPNCIYLYPNCMTIALSAPTLCYLSPIATSAGTHMQKCRHVHTQHLNLHLL